MAITYEDAIRFADKGEIVLFPTEILSLKSDREKLHSAALKLTGNPIAIFTRTDPKTYKQYFLVRKYDPKESISYEQMEREAKEQGLI